MIMHAAARSTPVDSDACYNESASCLTCCSLITGLFVYFDTGAKVKNRACLPGLDSTQAFVCGAATCSGFLMCCDMQMCRHRPDTSNCTPGRFAEHNKPCVLLVSNTWHPQWGAQTDNDCAGRLHLAFACRATQYAVGSICSTCRRPPTNMLFVQSVK